MTMRVGQATRSTREILLGAAPLVFGVFVFGISFGVLSVAAHFPGWAAVLMSALVFAASSQFAAIGVVSTGGGILAAVVAAALLNLRYIAMGIGLARSLPGVRFLRVLTGQLAIDESYALAVGAGEPGRPDLRTFLISGGFLYAGWLVGTLIGTVVGPVLGDPRRLGLDAAFPSGFVALLWPMLSRKHALRCAVGGAVAALALAPFTPPGVPLAGAALVGLWLAR